MSYHAWKRRLWGPDYPIENGPPYLDPGTGDPIFPGGPVSGPLNGMDDNGPMTGNPVVLTFTGTLTAPTEVFVLIDDNTASAPAGGRYVGALESFSTGATANDVGAGIAAAFEARNWPGWISAVNAAGTVTFTPQSAGSATGSVLYRTGTGAAVTPPDPEPDLVEGPFSSPHGQPWWHQRENGIWYYWTDIDADPEPDIRILMARFLANGSIDADYRADVQTQAEASGYRP